MRNGAATAAVSLVALAVSTVFAIVFSILANVDQPVSANILPNHVRYFGITSTYLQFRIYIGSITIVGLAVFAILVLGRDRLRGAHRDWRAVGHPCIFFAAIILVLIFCVVPVSYQIALPASAAAILILHVMDRASFRVPVPRSLFDLPRRRFWPVVEGAVLCAAILFYSLTFQGSAPVALPRPSLHGPVEMHYAATIGEAFRSYLGTSERMSNYGIGVTVAGSTIISLYHTVFAALPSPVRVIQLAQFVGFFLVVLSTALAIGAFRRWRALLPRILLLFLLLIWDFLPDSPSVLFPNQSAIRFLPALLVILVFVLSIRVLLRIAPRSAIAFLLPVVASAALLLNAETGVALACGLMSAYVLLIYDTGRRLSGLLRSGIVFVVILLSSLAAFSYVFSGSFDLRSGAFLTAFSSGYGARSNPPDAAFLLLIFFACFSLFQAVKRALTVGGNPRSAYDSFFATAILCWMPYYVNRMFDWNLWFQFIFVFLIAAPRHWRAIPRLIRQRGRFPGGYVLILTAGMIAGQAGHSRAEYLLRRALDCAAESVAIGGLCFNPARAEELRAEIARIEALPKHRTVYISHSLPMTLITMGRNGDLPFTDTFSEVITKRTKADYLRFLREYPGDIAIDTGPGLELLNQTDLEALERIDALSPSRLDGRWVLYVRRHAGN